MKNNVLYQVTVIAVRVWYLLFRAQYLCQVCIKCVLSMLKIRL